VVKDHAVWRWQEMTDQRKNRKAPLEQAFEWFLLARNFSPKTQAVYKDVLRSFLTWLKNSGYEGLLGDFNPQVVRSWSSHLEKGGRSINTRRGYLAALKSFSKYLAEDAASPSIFWRRCGSRHSPALGRTCMKTT
jgi:site-specific recombinase XerD